jgi:hypothetical protein
MSFYTDVIVPDLRFKSPSRCADIALLEPKTRAAALAIVADADQEGVELRIWETYRSKQRQQALYNRGKDRLHRPTGLRRVGCHHFGLAFDLVFWRDGKPSWSGDWDLVGRLAHKHGLVWGGNWPGRQTDCPHVQRVTTQRQPSLFAGTWYPDEMYNPLTDD